MILYHVIIISISDWTDNAKDIVYLQRLVAVFYRPTLQLVCLSRSVSPASLRDAAGWLDYYSLVSTNLTRHYNSILFV